MKDIEHLLRVAAVFIVVISLFLGARFILVPKTFGKFGHYRAAAAEETMALPTHFAGEAACLPCHPEQAKMKTGGGHRGVHCESCHGALGAHAADPKSVKATKPPEAQMRAFCGACHARNISRPAKFPQQDIERHNPGLACSQCHNPHSPKP
jgi:hypothetical protein